jgi:phage baseplate assembly protein W
MEKHLYSDLNLSMIQHPSTRDVVKRYDIEAIKGSVRNILNCNKGEKLFNPTFGADLHRYLFEPLTLANKLLMRRQIVEEITIREPRVNVVDVDINEQKQQGRIDINVVIVLKDNPSIVESVNINLKRVR